MQEHVSNDMVSSGWVRRKGHGTPNFYDDLEPNWCRTYIQVILLYILDYTHHARRGYSFLSIPGSTMEHPY